MNFGSKHYAIDLFSRYLKRNVSRYNGMSISRIANIVCREIKPCGFSTNPEFYIPSIESLRGVRYKSGALVKWNPTGGFLRTIFA